MKTQIASITPLSLPADSILTMPGSKSHANRAIIAACLSRGKTIIHNATPCDDVAILVKNLQKMGFDIKWAGRRGGTIAVGSRRDVTQLREALPLPCENAGTTLRFLTALACLIPGNWMITGNARMKKRPIGDLTDALRKLGADIKNTNGCPPIRIRGGTINGGSVTIDASKSSQFLSSLLLIEPALKEPLRLSLKGTLASPDYVKLTKKVLRDFGITKKGDKYKSPKTYEIEGDWSAAGAFLVLAELTNSRIHMTNLDDASMQADRKLCDVIKQMRKSGNMTINCKDIPDQVMNIAVLSAFRNGTTTITGSKNLRYKECDRLAVLTKELKKTGISIKENSDGVTVSAVRKPHLRSTILDPHDDHRMAMAFAILGSIRPGIKIKNPECVSKSYPNFFADLNKLHKSPRCIAIVGMRAIGKTSLAKKLAAKLKLKALDTDKEFVRKFGTIDDYVKKNGWKAFRKHEEEIVKASLKSGRVVSLGGGAIESAKTRQLLKEHVTVIWMQASVEGTIKRLKKAKRPALTNLSLEEEVRMILKKRNPLYKEVFDIALPERTPHSKRISKLTSDLCLS